MSYNGYEGGCGMVRPCSRPLAIDADQAHLCIASQRSLAAKQRYGSWTTDLGCPCNVPLSPDSDGIAARTK